MTMSILSVFNAIIALLIALATTKIISVIMPSKLSPVKFTSIDGLRGYLAFFVFLHHSAIWYFYLHNDTWSAPPSNLYNHFGQSSVALFFMITGLLFFSMLIDRKSKTFDWLRLFVSRILRLTPLYFAAMIGMLIIIMILSDFALHKPILRVFAEVGAWFMFAIPGMPNVNGVTDTWRITAGVTWSLMYEWLFYLSLPLIGLVLFRLKSTIFTFVFTGLVVLTIVLFKEPLLIHIFSFSGGIISAFLVRNEKFNRFATKRIVSVFALLCFISAVYFFPEANSFIPMSLISIAFITIASGNTLFGILDLPISRIFGKMAYSIYLLHGIVLFVTFRFVVGYSQAAILSATEHWLVIFVSILPLILICYLAHIFIELPGMSFTNQLTLKIRNNFTILKFKVLPNSSKNKGVEK